jgi:hypothetical protein
MAMPEIPALNNTIIIAVIIVVAGIYGLIAGKQRLRLFILAIYVGIVLSDQFAGTVKPFLGGLGQDQIAFLLLGLPIVIFGFFGVVHGKAHDKGAAIGNIIVGLLAGCLIVSSALHAMPTSEMSAVDNSSFLALNLQQYHLIFLGCLPLVALLLGFMKGEKSH